MFYEDTTMSKHTLTAKEKDVLDRAMRWCIRSRWITTLTNYQDKAAFNRIHDKLIEPRD